LLARSKTSGQAFSEFYADSSPAVLRYFERETIDGHTAYDLMGETFARAYEMRRNFRGANDAQAGAWLWAIARSRLARYRRSRNVESSAFARLGLERPTPNDEELRHVEELSALKEAQWHIRTALKRLPEEQRRVVEMRFMNSVSYEQIATALGVSQDVVRARSSRAIRSLRAAHRIREAVAIIET
jgi:RNA polymerase sigma-70 factor (ECF subfamily)